LKFLQDDFGNPDLLTPDELMLQFLDVVHVFERAHVEGALSDRTLNLVHQVADFDVDESGTAFDSAGAELRGSLYWRGLRERASHAAEALRHDLSR
jgi:hypothetical protein